MMIQFKGIVNPASNGARMTSTVPSNVGSAIDSPRAGWQRLLSIICWFAILLGIVVRFTQLPTRVLYVDEAITQIRVAGNTDAQMIAALYDGRLHAPALIQRFAEVTTLSTPDRVIQSLAREDAQHPPLFYVTELGFVRMFGNSLQDWRLLPAIFGLLAIPVAYILALELFDSRPTALLASALFAVSPIERIYSEQAREYSLFALLTLVATIMLLRAIRLSAKREWLFYGTAIAAGLYTHPFMSLVIVAHAAFCLSILREQGTRVILPFSICACLATVIYTPWIVQIVAHRTGIGATNEWSSTKWPVARLAVKWAFNVGSTFFDLEYLDLKWGVVFGIVMIVAALAIVSGFRSATPRAARCLAFGVAIPTLFLLVPDLILGEHRSSVARYVLPVFALLPLVAARGLSRQPVIATFLLGAGICASAIGAQHSGWWDNDTNINDVAIAQSVSGEPRSQVISTIPPPEFLSIAWLLKSDVRVALSSSLTMAQFCVADPVSIVRPKYGELATLSHKSGLHFIPVTLARALTAHELGTRIQGGSASGGGLSDLYRAVPEPSISAVAATSFVLHNAGCRSSTHASRS